MSVHFCVLRALAPVCSFCFRHVVFFFVQVPLTLMRASFFLVFLYPAHLLSMCPSEPKSVCCAHTLLSSFSVCYRVPTSVSLLSPRRGSRPLRSSSPFFFTYHLPSPRLPSFSLHTFFCFPFPFLLSGPSPRLSLRPFSLSSLPLLPAILLSILLRVLCVCLPIVLPVSTDVHISLCA